MKEMVEQLTIETEDLADANQQYQVQINKVKDEQASLDSQIASSSVKEHEIAVVSAMIDQKVKLAEEKTQLKR